MNRVHLMADLERRLWKASDYRLASVALLLGFSVAQLAAIDDLDKNDVD